MITLNIASLLDYALPNQLGFQPPASSIMLGIINLHHFAMFYIIFILVFVFFMIYTILETFTIRVLTHSDVENFRKIQVLFNAKFAHHTFLEILWVIIPSIILISIAYPSFVLLYSMEVFIDSRVNLKVIGHQWYWSYELIHGIVNMNGTEGFYKKAFDSYMVETVDLKKKELRLLETTAPIILPIKTYIRVLITSDDVLHCWAIPSLGVKLDAVPGRLNETFIYINRVGHFYGQCSEICGVKHAFMPIEIYGVKIKDFKNYCATKCEFIFFVTNEKVINNEKIDEGYDLNSIMLRSKVWDSLAKFATKDFVVRPPFKKVELSFPSTLLLKGFEELGDMLFKKICPYENSDAIKQVLLTLKSKKNNEIS